jgi:AraC-like DNA-binding protein
MSNLPQRVSSLIRAAALLQSRYSGSMTPAHPVRHLLRAKDLIDARYREPLDVPTLARAAHLSPAHFSREFRRAFGEAPHQYLLTRRLERAAGLLRNTDRSVADICMTVGLRSVGSFTTSFGRAYGLSPAAYRADHPPAVERARVPTCVLQAYARPHSSRFREDDRTRPRLRSPVTVQDVGG